MRASVTTYAEMQFMVVGNSIECDNQFCPSRKKPPINLRRYKGPLCESASCPKCFVGNYRRTQYLVDIAAMNGLGVCPCKNFDINLRKAWKDLPVSERAKKDPNDFRCEHLHMAREFDQNQRIAEYNAKQPREGQVP